MLDEYPYTLITGGRSHAFFHTEYRNSPWMREVHMFPTMDINPATAAEHGIEQDDWVYIETYVDRIKQRANLTEAIKPGMIHVEHDWWFPEREPPTTCTARSTATATVLFENNGPYGSRRGHRQLRRPVQGVQGRRRRAEEHLHELGRPQDIPVR